MNREAYLLGFLKNIQNQNFKKIEIIIIDDHSKDNSIKIIEKYIKKDKRIILLKNKLQRGTFINRNIGVLVSKGKYIIFCDSDDIISKNILNICFKFAEKYNFEMISYKFFWNRIIYGNLITNKPIFKKESALYQFYRGNELNTFDYFIWNKLIKKTIYIRALNSLKNYFLSLFITMGEDFFFIYFLYKETNSFITLNKIGYYYIRNKQSITTSLMSNSKLLIKFRLLFIKFFFENTKNNKYEKDIINLIITRYFKSLGMLLGSSKFYYYKSFLDSNIINKYLNCKFINDENKLLIKKIKNKREKSY